MDLNKVTMIDDSGIEFSFVVDKDELNCECEKSLFHNVVWEHGTPLYDGDTKIRLQMEFETGSIKEIMDAKAKIENALNLNVKGMECPMCGIYHESPGMHLRFYEGDSLAYKFVCPSCGTEVELSMVGDKLCVDTSCLCRPGAVSLDEELVPIEEICTEENTIRFKVNVYEAEQNWLCVCLKCNKCRSCPMVYCKTLEFKITLGDKKVSKLKTTQFIKSLLEEVKPIKVSCAGQEHECKTTYSLGICCSCSFHYNNSAVVEMCRSVFEDYLIVNSEPLCCQAPNVKICREGIFVNEITLAGNYMTFNVRINDENALKSVSCGGCEHFLNNCALKTQERDEQGNLIIEFCILFDELKLAKYLPQWCKDEL